MIHKYFPLTYPFGILITKCTTISLQTLSSTPCILPCLRRNALGYGIFRLGDNIVGDFFLLYLTIRPIDYLYLMAVPKYYSPGIAKSPDTP